MKSPLHPETELVEFELEPGLTSWQCPISKGHWIQAPAYWQWHSTQPTSHTHSTASKHEYQPVREARADDGPHNENRPALLCPESHCLLVRYRVGEGLSFYVDRSPSTGGIWLDPGEWEALKKHGLHASLHMIFSSSYQRKVSIQEAEDSMNARFFSEMSRMDADRLKSFAEWLVDQPNKRRIVAWLHEHIGNE